MPHREQGVERVPPLTGRPEAGGGQRGDRAHELLPAELQGEQTAQRVARHVRPLDLQRLAQPAEHGHHRRYVVRKPVGERGGLPEARQVDGDHVVLGGQDLEHRVPCLAVVADAVQQEQRLALARAFVHDGQRPWPAGRYDAEGHLCGHCCSCPRRRAAVLRHLRHRVSNNYRSVASSSRGWAGRSRQCGARRTHIAWTPGAPSAGMDVWQPIPRPTSSKSTGPS